MRVFGDDKYSGRRRDKYGSSNRSDRPQMYDAVCDRCGRDCKVPFKPSNDKPIYCSECFEKEGGGNSDRSGGRDNRGGRRDYGNNRSNYRSDNRDREMFSAICDDCGKECKVPFKPSSDKPIYCSECFEKRGGGNDKGGNSKQLEEINEKLDKLLDLLEGKVKPGVKEKAKKATKKKVKKVEIEDEDDDIEEVKEEEKVDLDKVIDEEIEEEKEKTMDVVEDMIEE